MKVSGILMFSFIPNKKHQSHDKYVSSVEIQEVFEKQEITPDRALFKPCSPFSSPEYPAPQRIVTVVAGV